MRGVRSLMMALFVMVLLAVPVRGADVLSVIAPAQRDARVPDLEKVTGHGWGDEITPPDQVVAYAKALAAAVPERVKLIEYARSLEGRPLVLLIVSSEQNIARLDDIRAQLARLGDPRVTDGTAAEKASADLPGVVWIACSVHGDEASGGDAGLALAYQLAAGESAEIDNIRAHTVVIIDPMQNPDGRARFVASTRQARGARPDPDPASAEHIQPWPGGRFSHELFDLNRDWFALTHPETRGRVAAMLAWHPVVVADLHEMGAEMGYYFAPPANPRNPLLSKDQGELWDLLGRANAAAFDAHGWRYWTRELFDAFYPGYGESWPFFSGVVGMTFEQASSRGLVTRLDDDSLLTYADAVEHHLAAAYTTCRVVAENHGRFVGAWYRYRATAVAEGRGKAYVISAGAAPLRADALAGLLAAQGLEVGRVDRGGAGIEEGDFVVSLSQPLGRLARMLLDPSFDMGAAFEKEQERRWAKRQGDEIYDITAWSLPMLWDVPTRQMNPMPAGLAVSPVGRGAQSAGSVGGAAKVAFLMRWDSLASARALTEMLDRGVVARVAGKPFTVAGHSFGRGTIIVRVGENRADLATALAEIAKDTGVTLVPTDTGYAEEGVDLGSSSVVRVKPPRVVLAWDVPTSPTSAGALRYALEMGIGLPVTVVRTATLRRIDLSDVDVVILPDSWRAAGYLDELGEAGARRLARWVEDGGTLIGVGGGAVFLTGDKVGLLSSSLEKLKHEDKGAKGGATEKGTSPDPDAAALEERILPDEEMPPNVPGAIVSVTLDTESLVAAGFEHGSVDALVNSNRAFVPLKLDVGVNVGVYPAADTLVKAGFMLKASRALLPNHAAILLQPHGRGRVIAFAEDPAFRGFAHGTMRLLANAVLFGPEL